jgi:hypothetical protein
MPPGRYTALFFLDEATAFAAGHRPCAECRRTDYLRFRAAWPAHGEATIDQIDRRLHAERRSGPWQPRTHLAELASLPDGAFIARADAAWLVLGASLLRWSPGGYTEREPRPAGQVVLLTPPSIIELFRNGYRPVIDPSAT